MDADEQRLEIYGLAVEMADRVSARRAAANTFFVTLNGALAAVIGIAGWGDDGCDSSSSLLLPAVAGALISTTWWLLIRYYRRLNRAKFEVINDIETRLVERPFTDEWAALKPREHDDRVTKRRIRDRWKKKHREATVVEQFIPLVFLALYAAIGIGAAL